MFWSFHQVFHDGVGKQIVTSHIYVRSIKTFWGVSSRNELEVILNVQAKTLQNIPFSVNWNSDEKMEAVFKKPTLEFWAALISIISESSRGCLVDKAFQVETIRRLQTWLGGSL